MARLYADINGNILRFLKDEEEEARYPLPPEHTVHTLAFDLRANAQLGTYIDTDFNNCRLMGSEFRYKGAAQTVNAPLGTPTEYAIFRAIWLKLKSDDTITAAEFRAILRYILRRIGAVSN